MKKKFTSFTPLREVRGSAIDEAGRTARVVIISEGLGNLRDKNFYTAEAVVSLAQTMNGKQFYIDHPSSQDEANRPERSVRDLAGYFYDTSVGTTTDAETGETLSACFGTLRFDESESGQLAFEKVKSAIEYQKRFPNSKDVYAGISINGGGVSHPGQVDGVSVNLVTQIAEVFSADIVTKPARGGKFLALVAEADRARRMTKLVRAMERSGWSRRQIRVAMKLARTREGWKKRVVKGKAGRVMNSRRIKFQSRRAATLERARRLESSARSLLRDAGYRTRSWSRKKVFREAIRLARRLKRGPAVLVFHEAYHRRATPITAKTARGVFREVLKRQGS